MQVVIIGNGITGITAARYIRKYSNHSVMVISGETDHFFSRTALMYIYMGHMRYQDTKPYEDWFWEKNNIQLKRAWVSSIDTGNKKVLTADGEQIAYDKLVLATGSKSNKFGWPGQDLDGVQGLYSYQDLELLEQNTEGLKHAVIVGGGLIGIELAEMLHTRHIPVTFLVREQSYWDNVLPPGESDMINRHIRELGFELKLATELKEILADDNGRARALVTNTGEEIPCQLVGLTAGVSPNIDFIKDSAIETQRGVMVDLQFKTSVEDVYAGGDCAQFHAPPEGRRPIEQVWYTGKMHGKVIAQNICGGSSEYDPGPWFNSAKFLDIEYQTYGMVMPKLREGEKNLYWEHEDGKKCVNIVYHADTGAFVGINLFGIRCRHKVFDKFLRDGRSAEYVLENLNAANFDPEFFDEYESHVVRAYNEQEGKSIRLKKERGLRAVLKLFNT